MKRDKFCAITTREKKTHIHVHILHRLQLAMYGGHILWLELYLYNLIGSLCDFAFWWSLEETRRSFFYYCTTFEVVVIEIRSCAMRYL